MFFPQPDGVVTVDVLLALDGDFFSQVGDGLVGTGGSPSDFGHPIILWDGDQVPPPCVAHVVKVVGFEARLLDILGLDQHCLLSQLNKVRSSGGKIEVEVESCE